jgi:ABC-type amino acid transport substrate-binding protein
MTKQRWWGIWFWPCFAATSILLQSCSTRESISNSVSVVDEIRSTHKLRAAYVVYPPFVMKDANSGKLSGYFIDLMSQIADAGQFSIDYQEATWGTMIAGLEGKRYDVVVSGIFPTIPRSFSADFGKPIMYIGLSGVAPSGQADQWTEARLQTPGLRVAVINGEVGYEYAKRYLTKAKLTVIDSADISRAAVEVSERRADVALAEGITMVNFAAHNPQVKAIFVDHPLEVFGCTLMVRRGDPDLVHFLDTGIDLLQTSGVLSDLDKIYKSRPDLWRDRPLPWK